MNVEFFGGIVFAVVVVFIAYRFYKSKQASKSGGVGGSVKPKLPSDRR